MLRVSISKQRVPFANASMQSAPLLIHFRERLVWVWNFTIEVYRQKRPQLGSSPKMQ